MGRYERGNLSLSLSLSGEISACENVGRMQKLVHHVLSLLLGVRPDANQSRSIYSLQRVFSSITAGLFSLATVFFSASKI